MHSDTNQIKKPAALRVIFILNGLMCILPFIFYLVFTIQDITVGTLDPIWMVYTGIAYILSFALLIYFMANRKFTGTRIMLFLNILIAVPSGAYIGILVAIISIALSFFNKKVKGYFSA